MLVFNKLFAILTLYFVLTTTLPKTLIESYEQAVTV